MKVKGLIPGLTQRVKDPKLPQDAVSKPQMWLGSGVAVAVA